MVLLRNISQQIQTLPSTIIQETLLSLNAAQNGKILQIGPEQGLPAEGTGTGTSTQSIDIQEALSHLELVTHNIMSTKSFSRATNLKADHIVKNKLKSWLDGTSPPVLWLSGSEAPTVSAIVCKVALQRKRPFVAVSIRHTNVELSYEEHLYRMVYSILYQLLHQIENGTSIVIDNGLPVLDLDFAMTSMSLALQLIGIILSLVPQCIVVVDGWHFIENGGQVSVQQYLKALLDLFSRDEGKETDLDGGRLLLTSLGPSSIITDLGTQHVSKLNVTEHVERGMLSLSTALSTIEW
jgi:hypothetical protein